MTTLLHVAQIAAGTLLVVVLVVGVLALCALVDALLQRHRKDRDR